MEPQAIGRYRVVEIVGEGASGTVYRAIDPKLARTVALKVLRVDEDESAEAVARKRRRLEREARLLARCDHPNVETIFDVVDHEGSIVLVAEYIAGHTLAELIEDGPLETHRVLDLGVEIARGLEAVHASEIVHGDLSPSNIRVTPDGRVKIIDFGIARPAGYASKSSETVTLDSTELGGDDSVSGTLPYMAPETLRGSGTNARSDVYGLGAVLYHCATGQKPFDRGPLAEWIDAVLNQHPAPSGELNPDLDPRLERIIERAMSKDASRRFDTAIAVKEALRSVKQERGPEMSVRRTRIGALAASFIVVALTAIGGYFTGRIGANVGPRENPPTIADQSNHDDQRVVRAVPTISVAVLPFFAASAEQQPVLEASGAILSEAIRAQLRDSGAFARVVSGTTSRAVGRDSTIPELGESIDVEYVLEGSLLDLGEGRTRAQLAIVETRSDREVWVDAFDLPVADVPGRATDVAGELSGRILEHFGLEPAESPEVDDDASAPSDPDVTRDLGPRSSIEIPGRSVPQTLESASADASADAR